MDNFEELVQIVTQKVLEALGDKTGIYQDKTNAFGVYGEETEVLKQFIKDSEHEISVLSDSSTGVVISQLSLETLMRIANMLPETPAEKIILEALLEKKKVYVLNNGKEYRSLIKKSLYGVKEQVQKAENQWSKFGAEFVTVKLTSVTNENNKKVITKESLQKEMNQGISEWTVTDSMIVTPLAKDFIREKQLKFNYVRNEE